MNKRDVIVVRIRDEEALGLLEWYLNGRSGATAIVTNAVIDHLGKIKKVFESEKSLSKKTEEVPYP